jgi:hypothetical protein
MKRTWIWPLPLGVLLGIGIGFTEPDICDASN